MIKNYLIAYKNIAVDAAKCFLANGILMYIGTVVIAAIVLTNLLIGGFILGGIIALFVSAMSMSSYLYVIYVASDGYNASWRDAKDGMQMYMHVIIGLMLLNFLLTMTLNLIGMMQFYFLVNIAVLLLLNAIPEVISNKNYETLDAIRYSFDFQLKNLIVWYLPNIILMVIAGVIFKFAFKPLLALGIVGASMQTALLIIAFLILFQAVFGYVMIFRQLLFRYIESGKAKRPFRVVK